jgi:hypothetical protein
VEGATAFLTLSSAFVILAAILLGLARSFVRQADRLERVLPRRQRLPDWPAAPHDALSVFRSPYKPRPLCTRCVAVGIGGQPRYLCRMTERCGLIEDEKVS